MKNNFSQFPSTIPIHAKCRAFTIVELLVAIGITAILVTLMLIVTINVLNTWNRTSGSLSAGNQARLVLDQITTDLEGAILRRDDHVWMAATIVGNQTATEDTGMASISWRDANNATTLVKPAAPAASVNVSSATSSDSLVIDDTSTGGEAYWKIENYRFGQAGVWLRFFTIPSDQNTGLTDASAPRAVSYRLVRRDLGTTGNPQYSYQLFRSEVAPTITTAGNSTKGTFGAGFDLFSSTSAYNTADSTLSHAGNLITPHEQQLLANDIVDFGVRVYELNSSGIPTEIFPIDRRVLPHVARGVFAATSAGTPPLQPVGTPRISGPYSYGYPAVVEVMIRVLTAEGRKLLQAYEEGNFASEDWWTIVIKNSQVYVKRIEIKSKAL